jgi:TolA-binding protein
MDTPESANEIAASSGPEPEGDLLDQFLQAVETGPEPEPAPLRPAPLTVIEDDAGEVSPVENVASEAAPPERKPLWTPDPEPVVEKEAPPLLASHAPPVVDRHAASRHGHVAYDHEAAPNRRNTTRHVRRRRRLIIRAAALLAVAVLAIAGYTTYRELLHPRILNPDELYAKAQRHLADRRYADASALFAEFAQRAPGHPARPDAQFAAALALHMAPRGSAEMNRAHAAQAIEHLEAFIRDNPAHKKLARARSLLGLLYYQAEDYERAIETLRGLVRKPEDQLAALPIMRTLARAYGYTGALEEAEATYLQATSLPRNYTPDADYFELGELYRRRADLAEPGEEKARLQAQAERYLGLASETSVIDPETRESIGELMLSLNAPVADAQEPALNAEAVEPPAELETPPLEMEEAPPVASGVALDPVMEAQQLGQPAVAQP